MRALFVIHTPNDPLTAVYAFYADLRRYLRERASSADVVTPQDFTPLSRWHGRWLPLVYPFAVAYRVHRTARQYDLAVFHSYAGWVVCVLRAFGMFRDLRVVTAFHGLEPLDYQFARQQAAITGTALSRRYRLAYGWLMPRLLALACRRSDLVTCCSRTEVDYLVRHRWAPRGRIATLARAVPDEFFHPPAVRAEATHLLFVGQWIERKGIRYLVEAFGLLAAEHPQLELWCAGTLVEERLVRASFPPALQPRVRVWPRVPRAQLADLYRAADVFVLPTLSEAFGRVVVEAMAAGVPVVTTSTGIAAEIIDGGNGLIVPMRDPHAIAEAAGRFLGDREFRRMVGGRARATAEPFRSDRVHGDIRALLLGLAGARTRSRVPAAGDASHWPS